MKILYLIQNNLFGRTFYQNAFISRKFYKIHFLEYLNWYNNKKIKLAQLLFKTFKKLTIY